MDNGFCIADEQRVQDLLDQLSDELIAEVGANIQLVGIERRGVPLARKLADRIEEKTGETPEMDELALKRYADDLSLLHEDPALKEEPELDFEDDRTVVLVDDVLFTGRTMFRAARIVVDRGADVVKTAVLCARGTPELPVEGNFFGLQADVSDEQVIEVHIPPFEDRMAVYLQKMDEIEG